MSKVVFPALPRPFEFCETVRQLNGRQPSVSLIGGAKEEVDLDPDALYEGVDLVVSYTVSGYSTGTLRPDNPFRLLKRIQVLAGDAVVRDMNGLAAYDLAQVNRGPGAALPYDRLAAVNGTVTAGKFTIPIDFGIFGMTPAHFGFVPARYLKKFRLRFELADVLAEGLIANPDSGGSVTINSIQVVKRTVEAGADPSPTGFGLVIATSNPYPIAATAAPYALRNIEAGTRYAGHLIHNYTGSYDSLSDAAGLTGNLAAILNSTITRDKVGITDLAEATRTFFPVNYPGVATRFDRTGRFFLDHMRRNRAYGQPGAILTPDRALDATAAREMRLDADVTTSTNTNLVLTSVRLLAVRQAAGAMSLPVA